MRLYAISDLHLGIPANRAALEALPSFPDDWLIVAGDVGETQAHLQLCLDVLTRRFAQVIWVPGNHDLWTVLGETLRGVAKYQRLVEICRAYGVLTPEDAYVRWPGAGPPTLIAPLFMLYDYTLAPLGLDPAAALEWAAAADTICADEHVLWPDPYPSRAAWCQARCAATAARLEQIDPAFHTILVSHFPLHPATVWLPAIPRFSIWCGTVLTRDWHLRFRARAVVSGHLHIPMSRVIDGVRFEEVSFGHPQQRRFHALQPCLREILPGPQL